MTILTKLLGISGETSDRLNEAAERLGEAAENVEIDEDKVETASEFLSSVADKLDNTWNASLGEAIKDALPWLADAGEVAGEVLPPVKLALKVVSRLAREADPRALGLLAFSLAYQAAVMDGVKAIENDPGATAGMAQRLKPRLVRRVLAAEPERLEIVRGLQLVGLPGASSCSPRGRDARTALRQSRLASGCPAAPSQDCLFALSEYIPKNSHGQKFHREIRSALPLP